MEREEAIEILKKNWPDPSYSNLRDALETLVPELAESEDVKMRKSIISTLQFAAAHHLIDSDSATKMEDWLKKQEYDNIKKTSKKSPEDFKKCFEGLVKEARETEDWQKNIDADCELLMSQARKEITEETPSKINWSKEDKEMIDLLIAIFEINHPNGMFKANPECTTDMKTVSSREIISWLQSFSTRQTKETPTKEDSVIINGWVVRDNDANRLWFCDKLPSRGKCVWTASPGSEWVRLDSKMFPSLSWSDEPMEVELNIKKK